MTLTGFGIHEIVVRGPRKPDAVLKFDTGLNVIAGASNTGKTYAWQLIDFMLGASRSPKTVPLAAGYSEALIEIHQRTGGILTLQRALAGGGALAYSVPVSELSGNAPFAKLDEKHSPINPNTISGQLLIYSGLPNRQLRRNEEGVKRSLSFRDVAWLAMADEERIITDRSPVLSGQHSTPTEERSAFGLLITGVDDSAIVTQEKPKDRRLRFEHELELLERLIEDRSTRFAAFSLESDQLSDQRSRIAIAIARATEVLTVNQRELDVAAGQRDSQWAGIQTLRSRRLFLGEQIKRLALLARHYASDTGRLESALEAGELLERAPQGQCPVCGHQPSLEDESQASDERLDEFQAACRAELKKISALSGGLTESINAITSENRELGTTEMNLTNSLEQWNEAIEGLLRRNIRVANDELTRLLAEQSRLAEAAFVAQDILDLRTRYSIAEQQSKARIKKAKLAKKVTAAGTGEFTEVVRATLEAWRFPVKGAVSWSDDNFDLVIAGEDRGSMGKGYRAVTHAAFTVALMRYCRIKGLPHPGFVVLDTPLNPYKGADKTAKEEMNMEVQEAFYSDLASDNSGDQIIVFENTEPPKSVRTKMRYTHFSGNPANPPAGFFPVPIPTITPS